MKLIIYFFGTGASWEYYCQDKPLEYFIDQEFHSTVTDKLLSGKFTGSKEQMHEITANPDLYANVVFNAMQQDSLAKEIMNHTTSPLWCFEEEKIGALFINGVPKTDVTGSWTELGGFLEPDLSFIGKKIINCLSGQVSIDPNRYFQEQLGNAYAGYRGPALEPVTSLILSGYSRGAVSCFLLAKELKARNVPLPVYIIANQPVVGDSGYSAQVRAAGDLTECDNLIESTVLLANCDADRAGFFQNTFFKQLIPSFHAKTRINIFKTPSSKHIGSYHDDGYFSYYLRQWVLNRESDPRRFDALQAKITDPDCVQRFLFGPKATTPRKDAHFIHARLYPSLLLTDRGDLRKEDCDHCILCRQELHIGQRGHCKKCGRGYFCFSCSARRPDCQNLRLCNPCYTAYPRTNTQQLSMSKYEVLDL